jgi:ATP-binding cassette subfamily F protein 3
VHLHDRKLTVYTGGYDDFEHARSERLALQSAGQGQAGRAAQAHAGFHRPLPLQGQQGAPGQSRLKALAKMEPIAAVIEERGIEFQFPEPEELAPPLIVMDNVAVGYEPGKPILNK